MIAELLYLESALQKKEIPPLVTFLPAESFGNNTFNFIKMPAFFQLCMWPAIDQNTFDIL